MILNPHAAVTCPACGHEWHDFGLPEGAAMSPSEWSHCPYCGGDVDVEALD